MDVQKRYKHYKGKNVEYDLKQILDAVNKELNMWQGLRHVEKKPKVYSTIEK